MVRILPPKMGDESRSASAVCYVPASQECGSLPRCSRTHQPNKEAVARLVWFRRKMDMDKAKVFTEQVASGSPAEASGEDMQRRITDVGAEEMPDDSTFFMSEGGGGFVGRAKRWKPRPIRRL